MKLLGDENLLGGDDHGKVVEVMPRPMREELQ